MFLVFFLSLASVLAQQECLNLGGTCIDFATSACQGGTWKSGLCPGRLPRCCIPGGASAVQNPPPRVESSNMGDVLVSFKRGDSGYDEQALWQNSMGASADPKPSAIFYPRNAADVQSIVKNNQGQSIAVRAGRHSYALLSSGNGIVIDVSRLREMTIDKATRTAKVQAGNSNFDIQYALSKEGFMVPLGTCPSVGAGFFLGGGYSLASRLLGLGADAVVGAEVVLADGNLVTVNAIERSDLFWALRGGGGGNFGVVVSLTLNLSPIVPEVQLMRFEWEDAVKALTSWEAFLVAQLDNKKIAPQAFTNFKGGARANVLYMGPKSELDVLVQKWNPPAPKSVTHKVMTWMQVVGMFGSCQLPGQVTDPLKACEKYARTQPKLRPVAGALGETQSPWVAMHGYSNTPLGEAKWKGFVEELKKRTGVLVIIDPHGAAINAVPAAQTAYSHRSALYGFQIMAYFGSDAGRQSSQQKVEEFYQYLVQAGICNGGAYINYPNLAMKKNPNWGREYYGSSWERLVEVKNRYDPANVFNHAMSVPLSLSAAAPSRVEEAAPPPGRLNDLFFNGVTPVPADNTIAVPDCSNNKQIVLRLNEVETGNPTVLKSIVSVCHSRGQALEATFFFENWGSAPTYLTNGCNDNVNPPYKSDAAEIFVGFANEQSKLTEYFEAEFTPKQHMWLGKITNIPGQQMKTVNPPCDTSGVQVSVKEVAGVGGPGRSLWQYKTVVPFAIVPGFGSASTLYGTFLRIAYNNPQFTNPKELSSATVHGVRNFHKPLKFLKMNLVA